MEVKVVFTNIKSTLINYLNQAKTSIYIAVAWFTDQDLLDIICRKASDGLKVELITINDDVNSAIDFSKLFKAGGKVWMMENNKVMHNKFCIIDNQVVVNGSYNWTIKAKENHENVVIINGNEEIAKSFINEFDNIKRRQFGSEKEAYLKLSLRLKALLQLIKLNDQEDIQTQGEKISTLAMFVSKSQFDSFTNCLYQCKIGNLSNALSIINKLIYDFENYNDKISEVSVNSTNQQEPIFSNIFEAAYFGNLEELKTYLKVNNIISVDENGDSVLHWACKGGNYEVINFLLNHGASIYLVNAKNERPIELLNEKDEKAFRLIFSKMDTSKPDAKLIARYVSYYPVQKKLVELKSLCSSFYNVSSIYNSSDFSKLLDEAVQCKNFEFADFLIANGTSFDKPLSNIRWFNIHEDNAISYGSIIDYLHKHNYNCSKYFGDDLFMSIFLRDRNGILKSYPLSDSLNPDGKTHLHFACSILDFDYYKEWVICNLVERSYDSILKQIDTPDKNGYSLLTDPACDKWIPYLYKALFIIKSLTAGYINLDQNVRTNLFHTKIYNSCNQSLCAIIEKSNPKCFDKSITFKEQHDYPAYPKDYNYKININLLSYTIWLDSPDLVKKVIDKGVCVNAFINPIPKKIPRHVKLIHLDYLEKLMDDNKKYELLDYESCLSYAKRKNLTDIEKLLVENNAELSFVDQRNEYVKNILLHDKQTDKQ